MSDIDNIEPQDKYIHRDLSWLSFNERVLEEAMNEDTPLLERLNFISIFVSNLDEFFMVRVAGLRRLLDMGYHKRDAFGYYSPDLIKEINERVDELREKMYTLYRNDITKNMEQNNIFIRSYADLNEEQRSFCDRYFESTLFPMLTPMAVDQGHPLPVLPSKTMAFAVDLTTKDEQRLALVPIPQSVSRVLKVPSKDEEIFILIEDIIHQHLARLFLGFALNSSTLFRVIRDSELSGSEEYGPDLLEAIESEVKKRPKGKVVNLEVLKDASKALQHSLADTLDFSVEEITFVEDVMNLSFLFDIVKQSNQSQLRFDSFVPSHRSFPHIFDTLKEQDVLLHVPFESFQPTVDFIEQAVDDENVLSIKMTLYRVDDDSSIIEALKKAAANKKQVTVLVEIKARFDEERNINWARELEEAGCHVVYGIIGMKIHSKICMIVRREEGRIRRYVHLSTGNYNEKTARIYSDIGYFTANHDIARDVAEVFNVITGYSMSTRGNRIITAPHHMREYFFRLIDQEIAFQQKNNNGLIKVKINALEDPKIIDKLYEASQAGVRVKLIVRGICSLIPGMKGLSDHIQVKSVIGRFLEHTRFMIFNNNDDPRVFLASADWMRRNFDRRIEVLYEMHKDSLKTEIMDLFDVYWKDHKKSHYLNADHKYERKQAVFSKKDIHEMLIDRYSQD